MHLKYIVNYLRCAICTVDYNFSVIEVWNFLDANNDDNDLVGVVMVPLHQFYTSLKVSTIGGRVYVEKEG